MNSDTVQEGVGRVVDFSDEEIGRISDEVYRHMRDAGYTGAQGGVWWNKSMYQAGYLAAHQAFAPTYNTSKQAAGEAVAWAIKDHLGGIVELTASQDKRDQMLATNGGGRPLWTAEPLYTTPPRHPADEGAVDDSMVERAARIVAELAGEDFDLIGGFAQGILLDTQRAALTAALQPGSPT